MTTPNAPAVDLSKYIETRFFGERPHLRDRRIPVSFIAYNSRTNGWTVAETALNFSVTETEVLAALLYYQEHQAVIDAQEEEEHRLGLEMYAKYGKR